VYFVYLGRGLKGNELFVNEVSFEKLLKVLGFKYVFEMVKSAEFCYFCVFLCFTLLMQNFLIKISTAFNL
jgi:hypothetical protein